MSDEAKNNGSAPEQQQQPQVRMRILTQYVRDLSFENAVAQKGAPSGEVKPEINVQVSLDARKREAEDQYEVITKYRITSKNQGTDQTLFLAELDYGGVFHVAGVPQEQLHPFLMIECPRMLFPYARRIISDVTRDGGFPAFNMEPIDFVGLYRQELARRAQENQSQESAATPQS